MRLLWQFILRKATVDIQTRFVLALATATDEAGRVMNLGNVLEWFAFDSICKFTFNVDPACLASNGSSARQGEGEFMHAFEDAMMLISERFMYAYQALYRVKRLLIVGLERR
ncbi:hypothetical protein NL676_018864 [Syzygium grande]|nr:hypothetical protein NL676_018864 [Syzygium grande]